MKSSSLSCDQNSCPKRGSNPHALISEKGFNPLYHLSCLIEHNIHGILIVVAHQHSPVMHIFEKHINNIVRKAFSTMHLICRNIKCNDSSILISLYKTYVIPILEYCSQVWSPFSKKLQTKIERVQKSFTKILFCRCIPSCCGMRAIPNYQERLKLFNLKSLLYRRTFSDLVFCFKVLKGESRLKPSKYWVFLPTWGHRNRFRFQYPNIKRKNREKVFNSLFYRGARWLQMLPPGLLESPNVFVFRKRLKKLDLLSTLHLVDIT